MSKSLVLAFSWNRDCLDMHYDKNEGDIAAKRTMAIMKMM